LAALITPEFPLAVGSLIENLASEALFMRGKSAPIVPKDDCKKKLCIYNFYSNPVAISMATCIQDCLFDTRAHLMN
jgi:hypothetical protein